MYITAIKKTVMISYFAS